MPRNWAREEITRDQVERAIGQHVIGLHAERNRAILRRRLIDGICYEPLAEEFGLSVRQVKNIVYRESEKILTHL